MLAQRAPTPDVSPARSGALASDKGRRRSLGRCLPGVQGPSRHTKDAAVRRLDTIVSHTVHAADC